MSKAISPITARETSGLPPGSAEIRSTAVAKAAGAVVTSPVVASTTEALAGTGTAAMRGPTGQ
jgi:hypothetical protein